MKEKYIIIILFVVIIAACSIYGSISHYNKKIDNLNMVDLVCENTYYLLYQNFGKVYVFSSEGINNSKIGNKRLVKITNKNKFKVFE